MKKTSNFWFILVMGMMVGSCSAVLQPEKRDFSELPSPTLTTQHVYPSLVYIPPGTYMRGSPDDELCSISDERPQHEVTLTHGFYMMTTEVTRQMWADLKAVQPTLPDDPSKTEQSSTMEHPVQWVTWYESVLFANLLSIQNGLTPCYYRDETFETIIDATNHITNVVYCDFFADGFRLPTEAEWEYAARAGTTGPFSTEEPNYSRDTCYACSPCPPLDVLDSIAWWCGNAGMTTHPVATKLANPWGLYDMHGNVGEWCWDWYDVYPSEPVIDPTGPSKGSDRVLRVVSGLGSAHECRSANRGFEMPGQPWYYHGFRLVRTVDGIRPSPTPTPTGPTPTPTPSSTPVPIEFVHISPGTYLRGSPDDEPCRGPAEGPQHEVTLTRGFYMMTTEVTRQMWADLKAAQPTLPDDPSKMEESRTMEHPVQRVTWYESVLFANLMSLRDGYTPCYYKDDEFTILVDATNYKTDSLYCNFDANGYRLPTEAEWEYACRAGTTGPFSTHEPNYSLINCDICTPCPPLDVLDSIAWWCGNAGMTTHPVATKLANPWGLYDMHGNVGEWCWDWSNDYQSEPVTNPTGPSTSTGLYRRSRGGIMYFSARYSRSAYRASYTPDDRFISQGFRLVRTAQ
jgi:formylglycine-generating enzyme required for sulfatase activity